MPGWCTWMMTMMLIHHQDDAPCSCDIFSPPELCIPCLCRLPGKETGAPGVFLFQEIIFGEYAFVRLVLTCGNSWALAQNSLPFVGWLVGREYSPICSPYSTSSLHRPRRGWGEMKHLDNSESDSKTRVSFIMIQSPAIWQKLTL